MRFSYFDMPTQNAKRRAQTKKRQGKAASSQAGEFVRSELRKMKRGKGNAKSRKQAVAIGLSEARREGVKVKAQPRSKRQSTKSSTRSRTTNRSRTTRSSARRTTSKKKK
jgi:hypothetical protein